MKSFAPLFSAALLALTLAATAADSDPGYPDHGSYGGYGERRTWSGGRDFDWPTIGASGLLPLYYRPTMRYYGNGYTVSYRYVPVYRQDSIYTGAVGGTSNFRTEAFHIATDEIPSWGANPPRMTVKDTRSAAPRSAVTSIVRKKTSGRASTKAPKDPAPTDAPAIVPAFKSGPDSAVPPPDSTADPIPKPGKP